jgi:hypothetical protein
MRTKHQNKAVKMRFTLLLSIIVFLTTSISAQDENKTQISSDEKSQVVDSIATFMTDFYVFPDKGKEMGDLVLQNLTQGKYDQITDHQEFSMILSQDLQSVNGDRHINVRYSPEMIAMYRAAEADSNNTELEEFQKKRAESMNFNFKELKILPGNVGYLKFNSFMDASMAGPTAIAAMNFLAYTDALIIDLRDNGGGSPSLIQLISSYFFEEPEHLNSFYIREGDQTHQFWTLPYVPGNKMLDTDIYVLTSSYTFSGAEEFTYNLKNMKRATIVGETTGGGAHPVSPHIINDHFAINIPFGKAVNPITNSNWEGTGIEPHIKTSKAEAYEKAYLLALEKLIKNETDEEAKLGLKWVHEGLKAKLNPVLIDEKTMKSYVGVYGPRKITLENGELFYQREDRPKMKMIPMNEDTFMFDDIEYFRLKVILENGKAVAVEGHYDNGRTDQNNKT